MSGQNSGEYHDRLQKLNLLREQNKIPYLNKFERTHTSKEALSFGEENDLRSIDAILEKSSEEIIKLSGRVMALRSHGKISFAHIQDFEGKIQKPQKL